MPTCLHCGNEQQSSGRCERCGVQISGRRPSTGTDVSEIKLKGEGAVTSCPHCGADVTGPRCLKCGKAVEASAIGDIGSTVDQATTSHALQQGDMLPAAKTSPWLVIGVLLVVLAVAAEAVYFLSPSTAQGVMSSFGLAPRVVAVEDEVPWTDLTVGRCFLFGEGTSEYDTVVFVPCGEVHEGRAFAFVDTADAVEDPFDAAFDDCLLQAGSVPAGAEIDAFVPSPEAWDAGDTEALCFFDFPGGNKG